MLSMLVIGAVDAPVVGDNINLFVLLLVWLPEGRTNPLRERLPAANAAHVLSVRSGAKLWHTKYDIAKVSPSYLFINKYMLGLCKSRFVIWERLFLLTTLILFYALLGRIFQIYVEKCYFLYWGNIGWCMDYGIL